MAFAGLIHLFNSSPERGNAYKGTVAEIDKKITELETKRKEKGELTGQEEQDFEKLKKFKRALEQRTGKNS